MFRVPCAHALCLIAEILEQQSQSAAVQKCGLTL